MRSLFIIFLCVFSFHSQAEILGTKESLFFQRDADNAGKTPDQIHEESIQTYKELLTADINANQHHSLSIVDEGKRTFITEDEARAVYEALITNPVVSSNANKKNYDPQGTTGFCFGRAMFVHLYLASSGLHRASVKKAFVFGSMDGGVWGWHVATTVRSQDPKTKAIKWLVIDSEVGKVIELLDWYEYWRNGSSDDKKLRLFITEAGRFGATPSKYDEDGISGYYYNDYFKDMMSWFDTEFEATLFKK
jgi:hypothetical protein